MLYSARTQIIEEDVSTRLLVLELPRAGSHRLRRGRGHPRWASTPVVGQSRAASWLLLPRVPSKEALNQREGSPLRAAGLPGRPSRNDPPLAGLHRAPRCRSGLGALHASWAAPGDRGTHGQAPAAHQQPGCCRHGRAPRGVGPARCRHCHSRSGPRQGSQYVDFTDIRLLSLGRAYFINFSDWGHI